MVLPRHSLRGSVPEAIRTIRTRWNTSLRTYSCIRLAAVGEPPLTATALPCLYVFVQIRRITRDGRPLSRLFFLRMLCCSSISTVVRWLLSIYRLNRRNATSFRAWIRAGSLIRFRPVTALPDIPRAIGLSLLLPYLWLPTFPRWRTQSLTVPIRFERHRVSRHHETACRLERIRIDSPRGKKVDAQSTTSGPPGRLTLMVVPSRLNTLSRRDGRYSVPVTRRLHIGGKAALIRLHALQTTSVVITGREPTREDAKAYFAPEETRTLNIHVVDSRVFRRGSRSIAQ